MRLPGLPLRQRADRRGIVDQEDRARELLLDRRLEEVALHDVGVSIGRLDAVLCRGGGHAGRVFRIAAGHLPVDAGRKARSGRPGRYSRGSRVAHQPENRCGRAIDRAILITAAVAMRHYVDVTDADFERTAVAGSKQAHKTAQHVPASRCFDSQAEPSAHEKAPAVRGLAASCDPLHNRGMEARGVEPLSRDVSARTSTCVSGQLESRLRVPGRQGASQASPELF